MQWTTALKNAQHLYQMWISSKFPIDGVMTESALNRIRASMLQDYRYRLGKPQFAAVCREIRGQFSLLGKIRKAVIAG